MNIYRMLKLTTLSTLLFGLIPLLGTNDSKQFIFSTHQDRPILRTPDECERGLGLSLNCSGFGRPILISPDEREKRYLKNEEERAILQQLRRRFQPYFPREHPIYRISPLITGIFFKENKKIAEKLGGSGIYAEFRRLDTLPLEWDFKLAKPSFYRGELIWGTLTIHNPNETPLILSIPYVGGEYINSIELWFQGERKLDPNTYTTYRYYHGFFPFHKGRGIDSNEQFHWYESDPIWRPMILAPQESYQVQLTLNVSRSLNGWGTIVLTKAGKHRFFLRYINVEAYLPYEKRKDFPNFDEKKDGIITELKGVPSPEELERKRKGPLVYRGIPVILGPYDVEIVEEATEQAALSKRTSTRLNKLRWEKASDEVLASLNDLSQSWPHEDPLKDGIRMSQVRVLTKLGREQEAAELVSQIASPDAKALKEDLQLPDPPQKEPEPVSNGEPEPMPPKDPPADSGRMAWIIATLAIVASAILLLVKLKRRT